MRAYRIAQRWVAFFLAAYFAGGLLTLLHPHQEVFPVYSWFLFSLVPQQQTRYALLLREIRGKILEKPLYYEEADGLVPAPHSVTAYELVQQFGAATQSHDEEQQQRLRRVLESNSLPPRTRYDLMEITFDPLTRWRTGEHRAERLSTFAGGQP
jgi:hypothetical protein